MLEQVHTFYAPLQLGLKPIELKKRKKMKESSIKKKG